MHVLQRFISCLNLTSQVLPAGVGVMLPLTQLGCAVPAVPAAPAAQVAVLFKDSLCGMPGAAFRILAAVLVLCELSAQAGILGTQVRIQHLSLDQAWASSCCGPPTVWYGICAERLANPTTHPTLPGVAGSGPAWLRRITISQEYWALHEIALCHLTVGQVRPVCSKPCLAWR